MKKRKNLNIWLAMSMFLLMMVPAVAAGGTIYVDADAPGPVHDGSSWATAYKYLQDALTDANSIGEPVEIRVADGIYTPDSNSAVPDGTGDRTATFELINGVTIKGRYVGFGEPDPNARDIDLYETILSGDLDGNDVDVNDPCDLATEPTRAENSYHVVKGIWINSTAILDGFTITGGNANGSGFNHEGGGMQNCGNPTVINCTIVSNYAESRGGGISVTDCGGGGRFIRCTISANAAGLCGGGASAGFYDNFGFFNCLIINNKAYENGGGIYSGYSRVEISNCTFSRNRAQTGKGGSIYCRGSDLVRIYNSILWGNTAATSGPEIAMIGTNQSVSTRVEIGYSDVQGGEGMVYQEGDYAILVFWGENIDADPRFADSNNGDYHLLSEWGRYLPTYNLWVLDEVTSSCIDGGDPRFDPSNEPVPNGGVINMGAYGGTPYASMSEKQWIAGDISHDGMVNFIDVAILAGNWLECEPAPPNYPPEVDIIQPREGAEFYENETITIRATAWDVDGSVVKIEFFANESEIGEDNYGNNGWKIDWDDHPAGSYCVTAKATDDDEEMTTSLPVEITVIEVQPPDPPQPP